MNDREFSALIREFMLIMNEDVEESRIELIKIPDADGKAAMALENAITSLMEFRGTLRREVIPQLIENAKNSKVKLDQRDAEQRKKYVDVAKQIVNKFYEDIKSDRFKIRSAFQITSYFDHKNKTIQTWSALLQKKNSLIKNATDASSEEIKQLIIPFIGEGSKDDLNVISATQKFISFLEDLRSRLTEVESGMQASHALEHEEFKNRLLQRVKKRIGRDLSDDELKIVGAVLQSLKGSSQEEFEHKFSSNVPSYEKPERSSDKETMKTVATGRR